MDRSGETMKKLFEYLKTDRPLVYIVSFSLVISLVFAFYFQIHPVVDAKAYDRIALNILAGNGFVEDSTVPILFDSAIVRAGPGYEFFLAGIYWIFGHSYVAVWSIQAVLHTLTALLVYGLVKELAPQAHNNAARIAAALIGFSPDLIEIGAMLMTETVYIFLITASVYYWVCSAQNSTRWNGAFNGFFLGITVLVRPTVLLFAPIYALILGWQKKWFTAFLMLFALAVTLTPWTWRNYQIYHTVIPTTLIGEYNLWVGNTLQADGGQISGGYNPLTEYTSVQGFGDLKNKANTEFKTFIFEHPVAFVKLCAIRIVRYFSLIRPMGFWFYQTGMGQTLFVVLSGIFIAGLFTAGLAGLALMRKGTFVKKVFVALAITAPLLLIPTVVQSRYRFQIYPFLAVGAGYLYSVWSTKPWKISWVQGVWVWILVCTLIDCVLFADTIILRLQQLW